MAKKYYAIKKGYDFEKNLVIQNLIVDSWDQCLKLVKGASGAIYKSFESKIEAEEYLNTNNSLKKGENNYPKNSYHAYVDGSYNINSNKFGYGLVIVKEGIINYAEYGGDICNEELNQRQVEGELTASIKAIKYAVDNNIKEIVIFYDYEGVRSHAIGDWERKNILSQNYYEQVQNIKRNIDINIIFVKVDSHTGDLYNDMADELSKYGADILGERVAQKSLNGDNIYVKNNLVLEVLGKIIDEDKLYLNEEENNFISKEALDENYRDIIKKLQNLDSTNLRKKISNLSSEDKSNILIYIMENYI